MAGSIFIEQESGTFTRRTRAQNGYYAGDFSSPRETRRPAAFDDQTSVPPSLARPGPLGAWS